MSDNTYIPDDPDNTDYQTYLAWLSEGNTPEPEFSAEELAQLQHAQNVITEDAWRASELVTIARQLEAIEEDEADETPPDLLPGTRKQWLKYRGQVSTWKEGAALFPDMPSRPLRPV